MVGGGISFALVAGAAIFWRRVHPGRLEAAATAAWRAIADTAV
jgi:hypothetical protein